MKGAGVFVASDGVRLNSDERGVYFVSERDLGADLEDVRSEVLAGDGVVEAFDASADDGETEAAAVAGIALAGS